MGPRGAQALTALRGSARLRILSLSLEANGIGDAGAESLAILRDAPALCCLSLNLASNQVQCDVPCMHNTIHRHPQHAPHPSPAFPLSPSACSLTPKGPISPPYIPHATATPMWSIPQEQCTQAIYGSNWHNQNGLMHGDHMNQAVEGRGGAWALGSALQGPAHAELLCHGPLYQGCGACSRLVIGAVLDATRRCNESGRVAPATLDTSVSK